MPVFLKFTYPPPSSKSGDKSKQIKVYPFYTPAYLCGSHHLDTLIPCQRRESFSNSCSLQFQNQVEVPYQETDVRPTLSAIWSISQCSNRNRLVWYFPLMSLFLTKPDNTFWNLTRMQNFFSMTYCA